MTVRNPSQTSFNGGEVSPRMISRIDGEVYRASVLGMRNFMPRPQGPAVRMPGTTFVRDVTDGINRGRVIKYIDVLGNPAVVLLRENAVEILSTVGESNPTVRPQAFGTLSSGPSPRQQIIKNPEFDRPAGGDQDGWQLDPAGYFSTNGDLLGCTWRELDYGGVLQCVCRNWKFPTLDNDQFTVRQQTEIPIASEFITIDYRIIYESNPGAEGDSYTFTITVSTNEFGGTDVFTKEFTGPIGTIESRVINASLPSAYTGPLYVQFHCTADEFGSTPIFLLDRFRVYSDAAPLPDDPPISIDPEARLYGRDDLRDIQFVQSPYANKELVLVHPDYPPQWLFYDPDTASYVFEPIPFNEPPTQWVDDNYPSACSSYQGRLVLAGTKRESETIWASRTGVWNDFEVTLAGDPPAVTPDSALQITTVYRSPIRWVYGQKDLMVGTQEFEYVILADGGVLQPSDIDVRLHSTHGSLNVQPAGFGKHITFAAERGTRVRGMRRVEEDTGWIAPDFSVLADHLLASGVRRMVRMRNPHQMLVCLMNNGDLVLMHLDEYAEVYGWSKMGIAGDIEDICVLPADDDSDILCALTNHQINGQRKMYLEVVYDFTYDRSWRYTSCNSVFVFADPTSTITGLDYLEGERVQVIGDRSFLGTYRVENGQIDLVDEGGARRLVTAAQVGYAMPCSLNLLPPQTDDGADGGVSSIKRYSDVTVRTFASTRPIINGQRNSDRDPAALMDISQPLDLVRENKVPNLGSDTLALVTIVEFVPYPVEVLSVSGKLSSNKL